MNGILAAMNARDWAMVALIGSLALVFFVIAAIITNLIRVVNSVKALLDGVTEQTVPLIGEVGNSVRQVNKELERVDSIVGSVQRVAHNAEIVSDTVRTTVTNPLVKALAFFAGARRGVKSMGDK